MANHTTSSLVYEQQDFPIWSSLPCFIFSISLLQIYATRALAFVKGLLSCFWQVPTQPSKPSSKITSVLSFHLLQLAYSKAPSFPVRPEALHREGLFSVCLSCHRAQKEHARVHVCVCARVPTCASTCVADWIWGIALIREQWFERQGISGWGSQSCVWCCTS